MNSHRAHITFTTLFIIVCIASIVILAVFGDRLSAGFQLFLYGLVLLSFLLALATGCYQTLEPGEVLIIFGGRDEKPRVKRRGAFVFPVITQVSRLRLSPMWIEFPKEGTADGKIPSNPENRLITKDGLPVTTLVRVQIVAAEDEGSIIKVVESFGQKGDLDVKEHFTKLLGGTIAKVIAETSAADLREHHQTFEESVQNGLEFETFGYRRKSPVIIGPVTQLSIEDAGLQGGDKSRAQTVLNILEKDESIRKIQHAREISDATAQSELSKQKGEDDKTKAEHESKKMKEEKEAALALLKLKNEEELEKRRIEKAGIIKQAELERDTALADLQVDKLAKDARVKNSEYDVQAIDEEAAKNKEILRAETDSAAGAIRLKLKEAQEQSAIRLRGEELKQNIENHEGDLDYQLKKLALKAATDLSRDSATAIAAALTNANLTLIGDPTVAARLATEQMKALGLGLQGKEILALLQDARLHDAVAGIVQGLRTGATTSQPTATGSAERHVTPGRMDGPADNTFEP